MPGAALNKSPRIKACIKKNVLVSLGSNSHQKSEIGKVLNEKYWS